MNNHTLEIGLLLLLVAVGIGIPSAMALQDPYPLDGYVVFENGTVVGAGANVTYMNMATGEVIYYDTGATGWYTNDAGNFPSGYQDGQTIAYTTVFGSYTNTTSHVIDVAAGHHTMNITILVILDSDNDGVPDAWDEEPNTPENYLTDSCGRGRLLGDMNGDGKLSSVDALMILQMAVR